MGRRKHILMYWGPAAGNNAGRLEFSRDGCPGLGIVYNFVKKALPPRGKYAIILNHRIR